MKRYACIVCGVVSAQRRCERHRLSSRPRGNAFEPTRQAVAQRDGWTCQECGAQLTAATLHVDHLVPRSRGGSDAPSNLRALCEPCNLRKGSR